MRILALDGHDGAGKTTLAQRLCEEVGAQYVRPFAGRRGSALMRAYRRGDVACIIEVGTEAITEAIAACVSDSLVLDRGWLTVSTLVSEAEFRGRWHLWLPTVLLWCDLETTLHRLGVRESEVREPILWHKEFLDIYQQRRRLCDGPVLRTDMQEPEACVEQLAALYSAIPPFEFAPYQT